MTIENPQRLALALACSLPFAVANLSLAATLTVPNASFEDGGANQYQVPPDWQEDQVRDVGTPETDNNFASSGRVETMNGLVPIDGTIMGRVGMFGDADPLTSFTGTMSTTLTETFAANTLYTLTFYAARDNYVGSNQWFVVGGLRGDGADAASIDVDIRALTDGTTTGAEDTFYPVTVTLDTAATPGVVGQTISVFVGMRHNDNYTKTLYFDNITLETSPSSGGEAVAPDGVDVTIAGADVELTFDTIAGQSYQILVSTDDMATFTPVGDPESSGTGDGNPLTLTDAGGAPASGQRVFYQVEASN